MKKHRTTFSTNAILGLDAVSAIPFARLRRENKAWRFAGIKLALICLMWPSTLHLPARILGAARFCWMVDARSTWGDYIFIANFWASLLMFGCLFQLCSRLN